MHVCTCIHAICRVHRSTFNKCMFASTIINAAARLIRGIAKFVRQYLFFYHKRYLLPTRQRIQFKICMLSHGMLSYWLCSTPPHGLPYYSPISSLPNRSFFRSSARRISIVPRMRTSSRSFATVVCGPIGTIYRSLLEIVFYLYRLISPQTSANI